MIAEDPAQPPRRVVHAVDRYLPFSQNWIHRQISWLADDEVSLVAGRLAAPGLDTFPVADTIVLSKAFPLSYWLGMLSRGRRAGLALAGDFIRQRRAAVIHAHFGDTGWRWAGVARGLGVPLVTSFYGRDLSALPRQRPWWRARYRRLFLSGARFLCEGPAMARSMIALGCPPDRIGIQRLGIDASRIDARTRVRTPDEPLHVLAAARFVEKKGLPDAIAAVGQASRDIDVTLTIAGGAGGSYASRAEGRRIAAAAAASGLGDRLRFVGVLSRDELAALAYRSHVFIQPSKTAADGDTEGGCPVVLIDLAATGLPAVATSHADIPDAVRDGVSGLLCPEGAIGDLAGNLVRLGRDPALLLRLSEGAAAHARDAFSVERCAASLRAHYRAAAGV